MFHSETSAPVGAGVDGPACGAVQRRGGAKGLPEAEALQVELQAFQRRITERGHDAFQGIGEHDDLVIAVALACWWPTARKPVAA